MPMRLITKLTLVLVACVVVVLSLTGAWTIAQESARVEADVRHDARAYGRNLVELLRLYRDEHGQEATQALLARFAATAEDVELRWVRAAEVSPAEREQIAAGIGFTRLDPQRQRLITLLPLDGAGSEVAIELSESLAQQAESLQLVVRRVGLTTLATVLALSALAAWIGVRLVGRPMHELVVMARRIGQGDLGRRLALAQRDEIGELAREMNLMCDRLLEARQRLERESAARIEALEHLRQADRLATIGQLAAGVAHELGTPLNVVQGRADLIAGGALEPGELEENARIISQLARRMAGTIRQVLDFARPRPPDKSPHDLRRLTRRAAGMLRQLAEQARVELHLDPEVEPIQALVDGGKIEQVLTNLIVNAIHSMPDGGQARLRVYRDRRAPPELTPHTSGEELDVACVELSDQGMGITPEHLARLWEPFFTTKEVGKGTGLGLPIARELVTEHGGWIEVQSEVGRGSTFRVYLPRGGVT